MPKLPAISGKVMLKFLRREGFEIARSRGSHFLLRHRNNNLKTTVPIHGKEILRTGTLFGILSDIKVEKSEFCKKFKK